jgi:hypothetical protein
MRNLEQPPGNEKSDGFAGSWLLDAVVHNQERLWNGLSKNEKLSLPECLEAGVELAGAIVAGARLSFLAGASVYRSGLIGRPLISAEVLERVNAKAAARAAETGGIAPFVRRFQFGDGAHLNRVREESNFRYFFAKGKEALVLDLPGHGPIGFASLGERTIRRALVSPDYRRYSNVLLEAMTAGMKDIGGEWKTVAATGFSKKLLELHDRRGTIEILSKTPVFGDQRLLKYRFRFPDKIDV